MYFFVLALRFLEPSETQVPGETARSSSVVESWCRWNGDECVEEPMSEDWDSDERLILSSADLTISSVLRLACIARMTVSTWVVKDASSLGFTVALAVMVRGTFGSSPSGTVSVFDGESLLEEGLWPWSSNGDRMSR